MRYAVVSDLHANLQAWNAVLIDIRSIGVDRIVCLGDCVGYGPEPAAVLESVHAHVHHLVLGNHDAVIAGKMSSACFNERARAVIEWTRDQLGRKALPFLTSLPYVLEGAGFRCCHGSPVQPARFAYVLDDDAAREVWEHCPEQLVFTGHSHLPGLFVMGRSRTPHWLEPVDFALEAHKRYIVNVGSVGYPRGRDIRASYCLFDLPAGEVRFRRVPFDVEAFRRSLESSSIPVREAHVLTVARSLETAPVRDQLDFSPPDRVPDMAADRAAAVVRIDDLSRTARRWRFGAMSLLLLLLAGGAAAFRASRRRAAAALIRMPARCGTAPLACPGPGNVCFAPFAPAARISASRPLAAWDVALRDLKRQIIRVERAAPEHPASEAVFCLDARALLPFRLTSMPVIVTPRMRFEFTARCRGRIRAGHLECRLVQKLSDGTQKTVLHYPLERLRRDRWKYVHKSTRRNGLGQAGILRLVIEGEIAGTLRIRSCNLKRLQ